MAKNLTKAQQRLLELKKEEQRLNDLLISDSEELVDLGGKLTQIQQNHISNLKVDKVLRTEVVSLEKKLEKQALKQNKHKKFLGKSGLQQIKNLKKDKKLTEESLKSQTSLIEEIASGRLTSKEIQEAQNDLGDKASKGMKEYLDSSKKHVKIQEFGKDLASEMDGLFGGMLSTIKGFINPLTAAVAILALFSANIDAIGGQFGAIGLQSTELRDDLLASSAEAAKLGKGFEDIAESITTLTSEFGVGFKEAQSMANEVISISMGLGLSTSEGGQLIGILSTIGGLSNDTAVALAQQTTLLAKSSDVAPQQVLRDIAGSSEVVAKFTHAGSENILRGAIQARKLGTNLETAASAAESMLDFQSAIEQAMTASVMVGRQINIQKLQELSLAGNLEGVSKEQRRLLGDQESFLSMNVLQREALAKAVGLSVDQAAKMLDHEEDAITLAGELANQEGFEKLIGPETISSLTELMGSLKSIGAVLVNTLGPPLSMIIGLFAGLLGFVDNLVGVMPLLIGLITSYGVASGIAAIKAAALSAKSITAAVALVWKGMGSMIAASFGTGAPLAIALGIGTVAAILASVASSKNVGDIMSPAGGKTQVSTKEGGLFNLSKNDDLLAGPGIANATVGGVQSNEVRQNNALLSKLIENFDKKYVPTLVQSNQDGGKKAGREIGRQFQMNVA